MTPEDNFTSSVLARNAGTRTFQPKAHYDPDGDCLECLFTDEIFKGKRLDKWVTVYYGRESGDIVGLLTKDVRDLMAMYPGLDIEIEEGEYKIAQMLRAAAWTEGDPIRKSVYRTVIHMAEESNLRASLQLA